jgi:hypothetical protein
VENLLGTQLAIPSLGGFTYFEFSEVYAIPLEHTKTSCLEVYAIPLEHTKTSCLEPMSIYNALIQVVTNILIVHLVICSSEQD